jgi:NADPH-dependent F420 reductase
VERGCVAVLGGTGALGSGLARRLGGAGWSVVIGSRDADRAAAFAATLGPSITGTGYAEAAAAADLAILTVPFAHQVATIAAVAPRLAGKILIDATVPLQPPKVARVQLPPEGSAAARAAAAAGPDVRLVSAFQNVGAHLLQQDGPIDCDVLVTGDDEAACAETVALAADCGLRAWHAGPLANAVAAEAMTSLLIFLNRKYRLGHAGIRITGDDGHG